MSQKSFQLSVELTTDELLQQAVFDEFGIAQVEMEDGSLIIVFTEELAEKLNLTTDSKVFFDFNDETSSAGFRFE